MDPILELIKGREIILIEDAAEAHGLYYKNRMCGSIGDISTFSFYANKHITTGEGGMVLTDSAKTADDLDELRNLGMSNERRFRHTLFGENLRMGGLQAALGISQINKIQKVKDLKKKIASSYFDNLQKCELLQLPLRETNYAKNDFWVFGVVPNVRPDESLAIQKKLKSEGIETRPFFWPLHLQPCFQPDSATAISLKNSEYLYERGFYLPMPLDITDAEILKVTQSLLSCL
jgi:perosamine synthetase